MNFEIDATEDYTQSQKAVFDGTNMQAYALFGAYSFYKGSSILQIERSTDSFGRCKTWH